MSNMITYVLTCVLIIIVLSSVVIVHLWCSFHRRGALKRKRVKSDRNVSPTLHEMIFQEHKTIRRDDGTPPTLHETIFQ